MNKISIALNLLLLCLILTMGWWLYSLTEDWKQQSSSTSNLMNSKLEQILSSKGVSVDLNKLNQLDTVISNQMLIIKKLESLENSRNPEVLESLLKLENEIENLKNSCVIKPKTIATVKRQVHKAPPPPPIPPVKEEIKKEEPVVIINHNHIYVKELTPPPTPPVEVKERIRKPVQRQFVRPAPSFPSKEKDKETSKPKDLLK